MPLIGQEMKFEKSDLRIKIPSLVKEEANAYCRWANIDDMGYFFAEAAKKIFARDKEWQKLRQDKLSTIKGARAEMVAD